MTHYHMFIFCVIAVNIYCHYRIVSYTVEKYKKKVYDLKMKIKIYLDLDDTLVDTSKTIENLYKYKNYNLNKINIKRIFYIIKEYYIWKNIKKGYFWNSLPIKKEANDIYRYATNKTNINNIYILSALPLIYKKNSSEYNVAKEEKIKWVNKNFPNIKKENIIITYSKDKYKEIKKDNNKYILIDDKKSNIKKWIKSGGEGIHISFFENK